jgi:hypothetical protein
VVGARGMSLAYFPMYPTDFDAKTAHLTFAEDGAYSRLLRLSWGCPEAKMPDDLDWICRKARAVTDADRALIAAILSEFFTLKDGQWFSATLLGWVNRVRKATPRAWIPLAIQREVWARDGSCCTYCKSTDGPFHLDHIYPWHMGGEHSVENLTVACADCNWSKGGMTVAEWRASK